MIKIKNYGYIYMEKETNTIHYGANHKQSGWVLNLKENKSKIKNIKIVRKR
jgi:hypothetical protein